MTILATCAALYGIGIGNLPLIVTDSVGLCCGLVTWTTAVRVRRRRLALAP